MKNLFSQKYRSFLVRGGRALAFTSLLFVLVSCSHGGKGDTDNSNSKLEVATTCTTSTTTSTTTSSTTSSTTTSTETTMATKITTTETQTIVQESIAPIENQTYYVEPTYTEPTYVEPVQTWTNDDDIILLAKLINHEASNSYDGKVMVGSCVVNRMNAKGMSVSEVIFEPYQFTTAYSLTTYTDADYQAAQQVLTQGSADSRIYYFDGCHPDGLNHFRDINNNYLGAW